MAVLEFATEETSISIGLRPDSQPSDVVNNRYTRTATSCPCIAGYVICVLFRAYAAHDNEFPLMDTPPYTPPAIEYSSVDSLLIHYCDFAYEHKGPFRMSALDIGETTAKTFAE